MIKTIVSILFLLISMMARAQSCEPSSKNCDYYACAEKQYQCGPDGYLLHFGERNCSKYLSPEANSTPGLRNWLPKVRLCLQKYLNEHQYTDCDDLNQQALNSHVECYVDTGFCELSYLDQLKVSEIIFWDLLLPSSLKTALQIQTLCTEKDLSINHL